QPYRARVGVDRADLAVRPPAAGRGTAAFRRRQYGRKVVSVLSERAESRPGHALARIPSLNATCVGNHCGVRHPAGARHLVSPACAWRCQAPCGSQAPGIWNLRMAVSGTLREPGPWRLELAYGGVRRPAGAGRLVSRTCAWRCQAPGGSQTPGISNLGMAVSGALRELGAWCLELAHGGVRLPQGARH